VVNLLAEIARTGGPVQIGDGVQVGAKASDFANPNLNIRAIRGTPSFAFCISSFGRDFYLIDSTGFPPLASNWFRHCTWSDRRGRVRLR
jgi:hypothetical protein